MTPLHPLAAVAAGVMLSAAAVIAPAPEQAPVPVTSDCVAPCAQGVPRIMVGTVAPIETLHVIDRPGLYGLSVPPGGDQYAVLEGQLIRIDGKTATIRSVLRPAPLVLD